MATFDKQKQFMPAAFRGAACFFMCLALCSAFAGCDFLYRLLDKKGAEEKAIVGEITPFEKNPVIEEVQTLLYLYGYDTGKADGVLGLRTRNALEKFQRDNGLEPSRVVDKATWEQLNAFKEKGLIADRQLNVRLVQTLLKKAGFDPGNIDGRMGPKTRAAVEKFQKAHQLKVDGKVGYQTLTKLAVFITVAPSGDDNALQ